MVTAYTLAFGSLLLPGGRLADLFGRKVAFLAGLAGVSAIGGASVNFAMLITARALPTSPKLARSSSSAAGGASFAGYPQAGLRGQHPPSHLAGQRVRVR